MRYEAQFSSDDADELIEKAVRYIRKESSERVNVKPLRGKKWKGYFRIRKGDYRIIFEQTENETYLVASVEWIGIRREDTY